MTGFEQDMPKYQVVCNQLKQAIIAGQLQSGQRLPSERVLVERFGVSLISIRGALRKLQEEQYIHAIQGRKGWFVAEKYEAVKNNHVQRIAYYANLADQRTPLTARLLHGISKAVAEHELQFELITAASLSRGIHKDRNLAQLIQEGRIDGVIIDQQHGPTWDDFYFLERSGIAFVMFGSFKDERGRSLFSSKRGNWCGQVVVSMLERGVSRIALATGPVDLPDAFSISGGQRMISAYQNVLTAAGMTVRDDYIEVGGWSMESGYSTGRRLLSLADRPEVVLCGDDNIAMGVMQAALDLNLEIPYDLKVWGNGDFLNPSMLSSVSSDLEGQGADAVEALIQIMQGGIPIEGVERAHLVERDSSFDQGDADLIRAWVTQFTSECGLVRG